MFDVLRFFIVSFKRFYDEYLVGFFFTICWSLNLCMIFFPSKTWLQISLCLWLECVCQYTHWIKISLKLSLALFISAIFWKMVGWVAFKFFFFMLKFKSFKMWRPMCLFILLRFSLSVWKVISYTERNVLWNVLIVDHQLKKILYMFSRTVRKAL